MYYTSCLQLKNELNISHLWLKISNAILELKDLVKLTNTFLCKIKRNEILIGKMF